MKVSRIFDKAREFTWSDGVIVGVHTKLYEQPVIVVRTSREGTVIFRTVPFLQHILRNYDPEGERLIGKKVLTKSTMQGSSDQVYASSEMQKYPLATTMEIVLADEKRIDTLTKYLTGEDRSPCASAPYGEVCFVTHALQRSVERGITIEDEDRFKIGRIAVKCIKNGFAYADVVVGKRYIATVSCFPRVVTTVLPYSEEVVHERVTKRPGQIEFVT